MKIGLIGPYYGKGNFGDNHFQVEFQKLLTPYGEVTVFCRDSPEIQNQDVIVLGGGSIINQDLWYFKKYNTEKDWAKKHIFLNVNVTDANFGIPARYTNALWIVRDRQSLNHLNDGIFAPDYLLNLTFPSLPPIKKVAVVSNYFVQQDLFSNDSYLRGRAEFKARELVKFIEWLSFYDWSVVWCGMQESDQVKDSVFSSYLFGLNGFRGEIGGMECARDASLFLSFRFHSSIVAITQGRRFLNLNPDAKCVNAFNSYGFSNKIPQTKEEMIPIVNSLENQENFEKKCSQLVESSVTIWKETIIPTIEKFLS